MHETTPLVHPVDIESSPSHSNYASAVLKESNDVKLKKSPSNPNSLGVLPKANQRNSRKALSNFLRKKKEEIEEDYATWQGRVR